MRLILAITILTMSTFVSLAQTTDSIAKKPVTKSNSYVPIYCFDSTFHVEKLEEVNAQELGVILTEYSMASFVKNDFIEGVEFFNDYSILKINQKTDRIISNNESLHLIPIYKSDIVTQPKYTIRVEYDFEDYSDQNVNYSIFDNHTNCSYKSFSSLEMLLESINLSKRYLQANSKRDQADLDRRLERGVNEMEHRASRITSRRNRNLNIASALGGVLATALVFWYLTTY